MSKKVYKIPILSRICMLIADYLPSRIRASVYIDTLDSLDEHYKPVNTKNKASYSYFQAISAIKVETLRREAYKDGLKSSIEDKPDVR